MLTSRARHLLIALLFALAVTASASTSQVIYSLGGDEDGEYPDTDLIVDSAGNIYGTTVQGGDFAGGTVFQLTPSASGYVHTVLYNFTSGPDGGQPYKGVTLDAQGNLYGTTVIGGSGGTCAGEGCGVVYKLTKNGSTWTQSVIYNFTGHNDGYEPGSGLTFDKAGNLYGTTPLGGAKGAGVIYELSPSGSSWTFKVIHTFTGGSDGSGGSAGRLLQDSAGNFYGVCTVGGANGAGTAYKLSLVQGVWKFQTLYAFKGTPDAGFPYSALSMDSSGNLYGTTYYSGANNLGSVYQLSKKGATWTETLLYSFKGGTDGASPISNVKVDPNGNLYGTTSEGGAARCSCGTIYQLTLPRGGQWTESIVYRFKNTPDAGFAYNGMTPDGAGHYVGGTVHGGTAGEGAFYQFTP
jgi:uncharacterized repeat protein (TIGR03803 family)